MIILCGVYQVFALRKFLGFIHIAAFLGDKFVTLIKVIGTVQRSVKKLQLNSKGNSNTFVRIFSD